MITNNYTLTSSSPSQVITAVLSLDIPDNDYIRTWRPKALVLRVTVNDAIVYFYGSNGDPIEVNNSTGMWLTKDVEYTFDPLEQAIYSVVVKAAQSATTTVIVSALRYIQCDERQVNHMASYNNN